MATVQSGDAWALSTQGGPAYSSTVQNGEWRIASDDNVLYKSNVRFILTVPSDVELDDLTLEIGAGALTADKLRCKNAVLQIGAGRIELKDFTCTEGSSIDVGLGALSVNGTLTGQTVINCDMGGVDMTLTRPADYGYRIDCGMGSVRVGDTHVGGMGNDASHNTDAETVYTVDCGMGSVDIAFTA